MRGNKVVRLNCNVRGDFPGILRDVVSYQATLRHFGGSVTG